MSEETRSNVRYVTYPFKDWGPPMKSDLDRLPQPVQHKLDSLPWSSGVVTPGGKHVLSHGEIVCNHCQKKKSSEDRYGESHFATCKGCQHVSYCSKRCQKEDWINGHYVVCTQARKLRDVHAETVKPIKPPHLRPKPSEKPKGDEQTPKKTHVKKYSSSITPLSSTPIAESKTKGGNQEAKYKVVVEEDVKQAAPAEKKSDEPTIVVVGATGYIGQATVKALVARKLKVVVGVRKPSSDKAAPFKKMSGVTLAAMDMSNPKELTKALSAAKATAVYLVTPGAENRTELTLNGARAAKDAGVSFIAVVSVATADITGTVFGDQLNKVEAGVKELGIKHTFLRLPLFMDNNFANMGSIKLESKIYSPQDPSKKYVTISTDDAGEAAAVILSNPAPHVNKTYTLTCAPYTQKELVEAFSAGTGQEIEYVKIPYDAAKKAFMDMGFPEWQVDGIMELFKLIDNGEKAVSSATGDFKAITGREATTIQQFTNAVGHMFKSDPSQLEAQAKAKKAAQEDAKKQEEATATAEAEASAAKEEESTANEDSKNDNRDSESAAEPAQLARSGSASGSKASLKSSGSSRNLDESSTGKKKKKKKKK